MTPGRVNFVCPQGTTFRRTLTYKIDDVPVNLSGYSVAMQIREKPFSKTFIDYLNTDNGKILVTASAGIISLNISASVTANFSSGDYVYDLEISSPSQIVDRLIEGKFKVTPEVTRIR
jgi:hypothetical protein